MDSDISLEDSINIAFFRKQNQPYRGLFLIFIRWSLINAIRRKIKNSGSSKN